MRHMLKVLLIAIIGLFIGNVEATTQAQQLAQPKTMFDLPIDDTPGLQKNADGSLKTQQKTVCGQPKDCVHVIVPGSEADGIFQSKMNSPFAVTDRKSVIKTALDSSSVYGGNIYFPQNGVQPTTEEAVKYSCANIDKYNIKSPITEWYMKMFGWILEDDTKDGALHSDPKRIKAGFDGQNGCSPIFVMPLSLVNNDYIFLPNHFSLTKRQSFWYFFRFIASSPVGRVLLYRILIEIRRKKDNIGSTCNDVHANMYEVNARNKNRHLELEWRDCNTFGKDTNRLGFCCVNIVALQSITEDSKNGNILILPYTSWCAPYVDISIFHELCHWFHFLRNPKRYNLEKTAGNNTIKINGLKNDGTVEIYLARSIYGEIYDKESDKRKWRVSALPWRDGNHVHFEELRNIIGSSNQVEGYLEGDDLSENLYRLSIGYPLRFGLSNEIYRESLTVVETIKHIAIDNAHNFGLTTLSLTIPSIFYQFLNVYELKLDGLDNCKYPRNDSLYRSDNMFPKDN